MNNLRASAVFVLAISLMGCTAAPRFTSSNAKRARPTAERPAPTKEQPAPPALSATAQVGQTVVGIASYYGPNFQGQLTANGEVFDMYGITAAHKTLPFNTVVRVINLENNKSLLVRINDRGPYVTGRMLDLSYGAAKKLDIIGAGTARVKMQVVEIGDNEYMHH